jgi:hypothetical protein
MNFAEFSEASVRFWNDLLETVADRLVRGGLAVPPGRTVYFPTHILLTELPHHFAMELAGMHRTREPLTARRHKLGAVDSYLGTFLRHDNPPARLTVQGDAEVTGGVVLVSPRSVGELKRRFPGVLEKFSLTLSLEGPDDVVPLRLSDETASRDSMRH